MKKIKTARREPKYTCFDQCLICKKVLEVFCCKETAVYTSDGELVCDACCAWLTEEGRKVNEL